MRGKSNMLEVASMEAIGAAPALSIRRVYLAAHQPLLTACQSLEGQASPTPRYSADNAELNPGAG